MNWQDIAAPLIKLGLTGIGTMLGGPLGGSIGGALGAEIASALGADATPEAVSAALKDNPDVAIAKLKDLEDARQTDLATYQAGLADVADARHMEVGLVQAGSEIAWAPVVISGMVILLVCGVIAAVSVGRLADNALVVGAALTWMGQVLQYWIGSSSGSRRMGDAVRTIAQNSAATGLAQAAPRILKGVATRLVPGSRAAAGAALPSA